MMTTNELLDVLEDAGYEEPAARCAPPHRVARRAPAARLSVAMATADKVRPDRAALEQLIRVIVAPGFIPPCLPTDATKPPVGERWIHEIKHGSYRLLVRGTGDRVRIHTRRGADLTHRFPLIMQGALALKRASFHLDGEGVVCRDDGLAVFDRLHGRTNDEAAVLFAFDLLELDGEDLRTLPLVDRKRRLRALLARIS